MRVKIWLAGVLIALLTSCGGGSVALGIDVDSGGLRFILWTGNFNGDLVLDADNQRFSFVSDTGCLYNYQTGRRNGSFCLADGGNLIRYQGFLIRIANIRANSGVCVAALVDDATAQFIDIGLDEFGREVVFVTLFQPTLCVT